MSNFLLTQDIVREETWVLKPACADKELQLPFRIEAGP
jgi:hypothetical protein